MVGHDRKNATTDGEPGLKVRDPGPARGLLHARPGPDGVHHHQRLPPSPRLATWVQHYWSVVWDRRGLPPFRAATLPHPNVHLVVRDHASGIHGVQGGRFETVLSGRGRVFGIKFRPGGFRPFMTAPVANLWNRRLAIESVFGAAGAGFEAAVLETGDVGRCIDLAEELLGRRPPLPDPQRDLAGRIVDEIAIDRELLTTDQLAQRHGLGARALQRLFRDYVGATPKWVINRYRLHEAIERLREGRQVAWSELALSLGYFDQAHFNRDFRRLVGGTPAQFERDLADAVPASAD